MRDRDSRHQYGYRGGIAPGLLVIGLGLFFLLDNLGIHPALLDMHNGWAWLVLLAAVVPASDAVQRYRRVGRLDGPACRSLLSAAVIAMVALMFLLSLPWHRWWPVFVIYGGLCMLARTLPAADDPSN